MSRELIIPFESFKIRGIQKKVISDVEESFFYNIYMQAFQLIEQINKTNEARTECCDKKYDYLKYTPTLPGKIAIGIATPSAIIGIIAVFFAFKFPEAFIITLIAEAIAVIGGIVLTIDIVRFNISQKKKQEKIQSRSKNKENEPKEMDIMRIVHMIIGIIVGIIIGYLIWGVR